MGVTIDFLKAPQPGKPDRKLLLREMWQQVLAGRLQPD